MSSGKYVIFFVVMSSALFAQNKAGLLGLDFIKKIAHAPDYLNEECEITAQYFDPITKHYHIYLQQTLNGRTLENATASLHLDSSYSLLHSTQRFLFNARQKLSSHGFKLTESKAIRLLSQLKNMECNIQSMSTRSSGPKKKFELIINHSAQREEVEIEESYYHDSRSQIINPVYKIFWKRKQPDAWLEIIMDGQNGSILSEVDLLHSCAFESGEFSKSNRFSVESNLSMHFNSGCYNVYPVPIESPIHGNRQNIMKPWLKAPDASPFGWHDDGLNFYYATRGNNVDAFEDSDDDDMPTGGDLARAYGGPTLNFDFPYDPSLPPFSNKDASITNLFYWANSMHDVWHRYGFNEPSGNFQMNNFNKGGMGGDPVLAQGLDNVYFARNNATFGTPVDGASGVMQVYLWQYPIPDTMIIETPPSVSGKYRFVHAPVTPLIYAPVSEQIILVQDASSYPSFGCSNLTNAGALFGKIAMVDRGICSFTSKMSRIQSAGAIAVIVCHNETADPVGIGGWSYGLTIPAVMLSKSDCQRIKLQLSNGVVGTLLPSSALKFTVQQKNFIFSRAKFGKRIENMNAPVVQVLDNSGNAMDACDLILNGFELNGKMALIDDGNCEASYKILQVQNYGAVAAILCKQGNGYPDTIPAGSYGHLINIPVIKLSQADCQTIRLNIPVNAQFRNNTPALIDGSFDAGIICHEYGHGISNRLTGGPQNVSCLTNAEQMGEGWSDFFGLVMTIASSDHAYKSRGMGSFSSGQNANGNGIRPYPYNVSLLLNPADYSQVDDITTISQPHGIGYIWCSMIWDLTWAFVKVYGLEADIYNSNSDKGNTKTYKLIIEAMKLQPCNPGFVDARNAILKADTLLYNGIHSCIIWNVFARRGLGYFANQNSPFSRLDGVPDYTLPSNCSFMTEKQLFEQTLLSSQYIDLFAVSGQKEIQLLWRAELPNPLQSFVLFKKSGSNNRIDEIELTTHVFESLKFSDHQVAPNEEYYYKVKGIDIKGLAVESKWVKASITDLNQQWTIYPNPVETSLWIQNNQSFAGIVKVKVFSSDLKLIDFEEIPFHKNEKLKIDCRDLTSGVYLVILENAYGFETLKFMKN